MNWIDWHWFSGVMFGLWVIDTEMRRKTRRWFRRTLTPHRVYREYRAAILQARSVLRLIEGTHFFESNLGASISGFIPKTEREDYLKAFKRAYLLRAAKLYQTQVAWRGAVRPNPGKASDW